MGFISGIQSIFAMQKSMLFIILANFTLESKRYMNILTGAFDQPMYLKQSIYHKVSEHSE